MSTSPMELGSMEDDVDGDSLMEGGAAGPWRGVMGERVRMVKREGEDRTVAREGGRGGRGEEEAAGSERGEHVDVHCHSLPPHSALVVRDGDVERGDERVTGDSESGVERGKGGVHVGGCWREGCGGQGYRVWRLLGSVVYGG